MAPAVYNLAKYSVLSVTNALCKHGCLAMRVERLYTHACDGIRIGEYMVYVCMRAHLRMHKSRCKLLMVLRRVEL